MTLLCCFFYNLKTTFLNLKFYKIFKIKRYLSLTFTFFAEKKKKFQSFGSVLLQTLSIMNAIILEIKVVSPAKFSLWKKKTKTKPKVLRDKNSLFCSTLLTLLTIFQFYVFENIEFCEISLFCLLRILVFLLQI